MDTAETIPVPKEVSLRVLRALRRRKELWRFLSALCRAAEGGGGSPYLVGGFVRDLIEGRAGKDIDLMLTGIRFNALGRIVRGLPRKKLGIRRVIVAGKQFAVYRVSTYWSGEDIDVALARSELSTGPGHRQFAVRTDGVDARKDAARRDLTINSMMFSLRRSGKGLTGEVIDYFGGMDDLRRRRIRGVGNPPDRIREDPLRMLRAIRQKNERPGYIIEKKTWHAIRHEAKGLIGTISGERLIGELALSLAANPSGTVTDLYRSGILRILIPEIPDWGAGLLPRMKKRYALLEHSLGRVPPETLLFANLLVDIAEQELRHLGRKGKRDSSPRRRRVPDEALGRGAFRLPRTDDIARRLHIPRVRKVVQLVEDLSRLSQLRLLRNPHAQIETIFGRWENPELLHALYAAARKAGSRKVQDFRPVLRKAARKPLILTGDDILALGIPAGPQVETILEQVREATLTDKISGREEAKRLVASLREGETLSAPRKRKRKSGKTTGDSTAGTGRIPGSPG